VKYQSNVWGCGDVRDPESRRVYGWKYSDGVPGGVEIEERFHSELDRLVRQERHDGRTLPRSATSTRSETLASTRLIPIAPWMPSGAWSDW